MIISVPAQTDTEYSRIASNQCSWAAAEFIMASSQLRHLLHNNKVEEFVTLYKECLEKASQLRKNAGNKHLYGENVDTPELLEHYTAKGLVVTDRRTIKKNTCNDFVEILHPDLRREFYTREYTVGTPEMILAGVHWTQAALVSRHGQSLAIIHYWGRYLVCDSHLHQVMVLSKEETIKHLTMDEGGHLHLTALLVVV
jgi:hypothetical protein